MLLWLAGAEESWRLPDEWTHPDLIYEVALTSGRSLPSWLSPATRVHEVSAIADRQSLQKAIAAIDESAVLPLDLILLQGSSKALEEAGVREAIPVVSLP